MHGLETRVTAAVSGPPDSLYISHSAAHLPPPPGDNMLTQLLQDQQWTDQHGQSRSLLLMNTEHLWRVLGYLRWYAAELRGLATVSLAREELSTRNWLITLPLWRAISLELRRRSEMRRAAEAIDLLESAGAVPWESESALID